ncbi:aminopeptidase P family protein [Staphylococcus condimenti]|uniref:Aminopeptidase P family protein n=1 Tax=Staphylococcus condimenti TaxID=70255 RepID=A0A143P9S1_9STAP|nr:MULTISPECIES: Xaa-Pro peptidase family protein [Staphylococcus]AMY04559.1 metallopeptidase [Staphylococcus condimenti]APR60797.1 peptidase M24 family protein [Staphylococcus condimenti]MDK8644759.1 Xaa-Pro peptidase family protein [Staphylococcus condimenti]OFO98940.1 metallopeptidase [Staphylococcus sp. HMSC065E08]PNZ62154.1 aminopeptidase P family protein [Staphylococcus condimenti]
MVKTDEIVKEIRNQDAGAAWITTPLNVFYFTGYLSEPHERLLALLITAEGEQVLFVPKLEVEEVKASPFKGKVVGNADGEDPFKLVDYHFDKLLVENEHLTLKRQKELIDGFGVETFGDIDGTIKALRNVKTSEEIDKIKKAAELADKCIEIGVNFLKEGVTEKQVVRHIEYEIQTKYGVDQMSFDTMVLFGDHAASPHGVPGDRELQKDEYVLFDLGVVYEQYCSDMTRTVPFGTPDQKAKEVYDIVLKAEKEAIDMIKPGVVIGDVDKKARGIISEAGYGEYFVHRLGHGLGLEEHEYQDVASHNTNKFVPGMVVTVEPGIYVPNEVGVRIEDDILVTEDGHEILTHYEK